MKSKRVSNGYWIEERIQAEANKYKRRTDFCKNSYAAYRAAHKKGKAFLDKICLHMDPSMTEAYTDEELFLESIKYKNRTDLQRQNPKYYDAICYRGKEFRDVAFAHMDPSMTEAYTEEEIQLEANKYTKRSIFAEKSSGAYQSAQTRGREFLDRVCSHMNPSTTEAYTDEELATIAKKHQRRVDFERENGGAYVSACKKGADFLDKICLHMDPSMTEAYTEEEIRTISSKCKTFTEFKKKSNGAYKAAKRMGILGQVRSHMVQLKGTSIPEETIMAAVIKAYPDAKKIKDCRVKIDGKPYIHGFEIDILVGKLGIEFDGKYHHSFKYMRANRNKRLWSDEDVHNYHDLKDTWFWEARGIRILHIKEEDWDLDPQACIQRCLDFLASK